MKPKEYLILERAVEEGIAHGWRRGFKHQPTDPPEGCADAVREALREEVLNAICEVFDFEAPPGEPPA